MNVFSFLIRNIYTNMNVFNFLIVKFSFQEMGRTNYYVVFEGRVSGIYDNWEEAKNKVWGYSGDVHRKFSDLKRTEAAFIYYW